MELHFIKLSHCNYRLICFDSDQNELYNKTLESKSLLRHDFMHYCVESIADLQNSFYGDIKGNKIVDIDEIMMTERIVVQLQKLDIDQNYTPANYFKNVTNSFLYQNEKPPNYFNVDFVEKVGNLYINLIQQFYNLKTGIGNKIVIEF